MGRSFSQLTFADLDWNAADLAAPLLLWLYLYSSAQFTASCYVLEFVARSELEGGCVL
jgi:hypothetical protein